MKVALAALAHNRCSITSYKYLSSDTYRDNLSCGNNGKGADVSVAR